MNNFNNLQFSMPDLIYANGIIMNAASCAQKNFISNGYGVNNCYNQYSVTGGVYGMSTASGINPNTIVTKSVLTNGPYVQFSDSRFNGCGTDFDTGYGKNGQLWIR